MPTKPTKPNTELWDIEAKLHEKRVYFNKPQLMAQYIAAKTTVIVAGRRTGKTDSIASPFVLRNMQRMPGSTGGIVVPTFKHGLTNTIPGLLAAWKRWGYINGIHYVVGRKPPKSFGKPITEPADYEHVITFYNGSVAIIISQDRPGSSNSLVAVDRRSKVHRLQQTEGRDAARQWRHTLVLRSPLVQSFHDGAVRHAADTKRVVVPALQGENGSRTH